MNKSALEFRDIKSLLGKKKQAKHLSSMPFLSLLTLTACGGGSNTSDTSGDSAPATTAYSGSVIKGPLQNALVFLDYDGDGVLGANEPSVRTGSDGSFSVDGTMSGVSFVAQTDSTTLDTSSGEILDNVVLKAPSGSTVVTPATTIMKEAGITKEEVSAVLGLPAGVDPTTFNPYSADADPAVALAVEKVSQQVMTTITAVSSAVEGAGADKAAAFSVALETVVEIVKEKAAVVQADPTAEIVTLDFSKTEEIQAVTEKVSTKIQEQGIATKEDFDAVKADLDVAVTNVNTKINEVTDLTSEDSMAAFAVATELKTQVKAAVESKGDPAAAITFTDAAKIDEAKNEKAAEIKEKIDSGELVTKPEPTPEPTPDPTPEPEPTPGASQSDDDSSLPISSESFSDGAKGYLRLKYSNIKEHDNGAYLGELEWVYSADPTASVSLSVYPGYDYLRLDGTSLYLADGYHLDYEGRIVSNDTYKITKFSPVSFSANTASWSWSGFETTSAVIQVDGLLTGGGDIAVWDEIQIVFEDISDEITVLPLEFDGYLDGATVATLKTSVKTASYEVTEKTFLEMANDELKLKQGFYFDPHNSEVVNISDSTYYPINSDTKVNILSYQSSKADINLVDEIKLVDVFSNATSAAIPYYAGSPVGSKQLSGQNNIDALLSEQPSDLSSTVVWANNPNYNSNSGITTVTYSFVPSAVSDQKFAITQSEPTPGIDQISELSEVHKESVKLALSEWAKVAKISFVEIQETNDQAGTLRFGFTDYNELAANGDIAAAWAISPSSAPASGDIWLHHNTASDNYSQGTGYGFATLIHEIGHALGLKHPFEGAQKLSSDLDKTNYTIMSYTDDENAYYNKDYIISSSPMVLDISAIQYLYGAADNNTADTIYSFNPSNPFAQAIWDTSGTDTIKLDNFQKGCTVDLNPGAYSTIVCDDWSLADNLGIAYNTSIENVIGGSGNDIIVGNDLGNQISGGAGYDTLSGGGGSDVFLFKTSELSNLNFDTIADFQSGVDKIKLVIDEAMHLSPSAQAGQISVVNPSSGNSLVGSAQSDESESEKESAPAPVSTPQPDVTSQSISSPLKITAKLENSDYKIVIDSTNEVIVLLQSGSLFNIENDLLVETAIA